MSIIMSRNDNSHSESMSGRCVITQSAFTLVRLLSAPANDHKRRRFSGLPEAHDARLLICGRLIRCDNASSMFIAKIWGGVIGVRAGWSARCKISDKFE